MEKEEYVGKRRGEETVLKSERDELSQLNEGS